MIGLNVDNKNFGEKLIMTDEAHFHLSDSMVYVSFCVNFFLFLMGREYGVC
jgi:hypothetical protein